MTTPVKLHRVGTEQEVTVQKIRLKQPVSYPSEFFANDPSRPPLPIEIISDDLMDNYRNNIVNTLLQAHKLLPEVIYSYLLGFCQRNPEDLEEKWTTFGLTLNPGSITSLDLFKPIEYKPPDIPTVEGTATKEDDIWIVLAIMGIYRLKSITRTDHQVEIADRLHAILSEFKSIKIHYAIQDSIYQVGKLRKLIAGMDMFYFKFKICIDKVRKYHRQI